jgi:hypothetical protein
MLQVSGDVCIRVELDVCSRAIGEAGGRSDGCWAAIKGENGKAVSRVAMRGAVWKARGGVVVKLESGLRERGKWPGELVEIAKDGRRVRFGSKNDLLAHGVLKKASGHGLT